MLRLLAAAVLAAAAATAALAVTRPDPATQAQLDGCQRTQAGIVLQQTPEWVFVGDHDAPASGAPPAPQWASGTLPPTHPRFFAVHPTGADNPTTHDSYDVNLNVLPDAAYANLMATSNLEGDDEESSRLHSELEQAAFPPFAWPEQGNRLRLLGNWIWDCGHWTPDGEHTEFHPYRAIWVDRGVSPRSPWGETEGDLLITTDQTPAGKQEVCAHQTKGDKVAFHACLATIANWQDVNGAYTFTLKAPPRPSPAAQLRVRVVDEGSVGAPAVSAVPSGSGAKVALTIEAPAGQRVVVAKEVFVGWSPVPASALPIHLKLAFQKLLVRRAQDPGCPASRSSCGSVETRHGAQITSAPGEWAVYSDVAGIWSSWAPPVLRPRDGQTLALSRSVDLYVGARSPWRLFVFARECDFGTLSAGNPTRPPAPCSRSAEFGDTAGDDVPGSVVDRYPSPAASVGVHASDASRDVSTCPAANAQGCYRLTYTVAQIDDADARARSRR